MEQNICCCRVCDGCSLLIVFEEFIFNTVAHNTILNDIFNLFSLGEKSKILQYIPKFQVYSLRQQNV